MNGPQISKRAKQFAGLALFSTGNEVQQIANPLPFRGKCDGNKHRGGFLVGRRLQLSLLSFRFHFFAKLPEQSYAGVRQETVHLCAAERVDRETKHFVEEEPGVRKRTLTSFDVTSDSLAAWLANRLGAARLVLVKSCAIPLGRTMREHAAAGIVDARFADAVRDASYAVDLIDKDELGRMRALLAAHPAPRVSDAGAA